MSRIRTVRLLSCVLSLVAVVGAPADATAQTPTKLMVRVTANDAKIIGASVGGAYVTVRDAQTGEVLAAGVQGGGTGNTGMIMGARERGVPVFDTEGAGGFLAELALDAPTWVEIEARGPLGTPDALRTASRSTLLLPGKDVLGDGIVLELLGFTVELQQPAVGGGVQAGEPIAVRARVTMLCGCPTSPGGTWDSDDYTILARVVRDGVVEQEVPMSFAGETSIYTGTLRPVQSGSVVVEVLAMDAEKGNFGTVTQRFDVGR